MLSKLKTAVSVTIVQYKYKTIERTLLFIINASNEKLSSILSGYGALLVSKAYYYFHTTV